MGICVEALKRALHAELSLDQDFQDRNLNVEKLPDSSNERYSNSYPDVPTLYNFHNVKLQVKDPQAARLQTHSRLSCVRRTVKATNRADVVGLQERVCQMVKW